MKRSAISTWTLGLGLLIPLCGSALAGTVALETPQYCRINDQALNALAEGTMTRQSPRDPVRNNLYLKLEAATPSGTTIRAIIVNVLHAHPGDQFHIELYAAGKLLFKSGRQDNPIFIEFRVDEKPYSLTCFEDIPE